MPYRRTVNVKRRLAARQAAIIAAARETASEGAMTSTSDAAGPPPVVKSPEQRRAELRVDVVGRQVKRHVVTEMRQHPGEVESRHPFPGLAVFRGQLPPGRKVEDATPHLWQARRTDHDRTQE